MAGIHSAIACLKYAILTVQSQFCDLVQMIKFIICEFLVNVKGVWRGKMAISGLHIMDNPELVTPGWYHIK